MDNKAFSMTPVESQGEAGGQTDHETNGNIKKSPTNENIEMSPTNGDMKKSPTNGNIKKSPTNENIKMSPTNGDMKKSPTNGRINVSPAKMNPINGGLVDNKVRPETAETSSSHQEPAPVKPLWLCSLMVKKNTLFFGVTLALNISLILVTGILYLAGYDIYPVAFSEMPVALPGYDNYLRSLAWRQRDEGEGLIGKNSSAAVIGERSRIGDTLEVVLQADNVLTIARLQAIHKLEQDLITSPEYTDYCYLNYDDPANPVCQAPMSLIRFFDGTYGAAFNDMTFSNISDFLRRAYASDATRGYLLPLVSKDTVLDDPGELTSTATKIDIHLGVPLPGYDMTSANEDAQNDKLQDFQVDSFLGILKDAAGGLEGMSVLYTSLQLFEYAFVPEVYQGMFLAGGAFMFILIFITVHTRSLLMSCLSVFSILCSFFGTNLIYNLVFDYDYFGVLQILAMFIILGIGADNVFVLVDSWRAAGFEGYTDLEERLTVCYKRAAKAMFVTSLTTCVAFLSNAFSPILVSSSFGVFAGVLVMFNYVSVLLFLPNVLILHHVRWADKTWPCCRCCKRESSENKQSIIVKFFHGPLFQFITHKILRWIILLVCLGLLATFIYSATRIESAIGRFQMFRDENNYQKISVALSTKFLPATDTEVDVYLVWGLKKQDYSDCNPRALKCNGRTTWDDTFDLDVTSAQTSLRDLCTTIENMNDDQAAKLRVKKDEATGKWKVTCFISNLATFMNTDAGLSLPYERTNMLPFVTGKSSLYDASNFNTDFRRYFETALSYWLENKYSGVKSDDYRTFFQYVGESRDESDTHNILDPQYSDLFYGTRMRYAGISVKTTLTPEATPHREGLRIRNAWEDYMNELKESLPESLQGGFQCTPSGEWTWYNIQDLNQQAAIQGMAIGLSMAFVILTLTTTNIVIGFLATLNIVCVTACVLGLIPFAGWKLGLVESLNLALVVGLAVDYVVHLAEAYHSAEQEDRVGKVRHMLTRVGVSILSGAATTLGSSIFMCFGTLQFFLVFGVFIITTISLSLFFSIFLFGTAMAIIGPTGNFGSLMPIWHWLKNKCCKNCCKKNKNARETQPEAEVP